MLPAPYADDNIERRPLLFQGNQFRQIALLAVQVCIMRLREIDQPVLSLLYKARESVYEIAQSSTGYRIDSEFACFVGCVARKEADHSIEHVDLQFAEAAMAQSETSYTI